MLSCNIQGAGTMSHEINQLDIPDRQLLATRSQPRVSMSREIGEAQITHTIFGRAKVRIIRKNDGVKRTFWLAALALLAIAAVIWQGWFTSQLSEPLPGSDLPIPANAMVQESVPVAQTENISPFAILQPEPDKPGAPTQIETKHPAISQKSVPQQPQGLKAAEQKAVQLVVDLPMPVAAQAKPTTPQPKQVKVQAQPNSALSVTSSKQQAAPLAANNSAPKKPTEPQLPAKPIAPKQYVAPSVATAATMKPVAQSAAGSPVAVPLVQDDSATKSPVGDKLLSEPVNAQSN
jgi:hypothetical protein